MAKLLSGNAEMNGKKRPCGSVGVQIPAQIPSLVDNSIVSSQFESTRQE
jgi:hypothetical protein